MKILITGGAGFIGSHLSNSLLAMGHKVIILDNFDPFYSRDLKGYNLKDVLTSQNAELIIGDIRDNEILHKVFRNKDIDVVIHLAAKAGVRPSIDNPHEYYDVNITGTLNILKHMKDHGVNKMIFASSSSVYGNNPTVPFAESDFVDNPISPYAATKKSGELLCHVFSHLYNFHITCLRFFTVYGPGQRPDLAIHKFTKLITEGHSIPFFGDGDTARDYTYVDDIVSGIIKSIENLDGYRIYNLGESKTITLSNLVSLLSTLLKQEAILNKLPKQSGDVDITYANIAKAKKEIGYNPCVNIEDGLQEFIKWFHAYNINIKKNS